MSRFQSGKKISAHEKFDFLQSMEFDEILPLAIKLKGKPMNVIDRRPMFRHLFQRNPRAKKSVSICARQIGKALDIETPIPTPSGWTTMGAISVGDLVFAEDGTPTRVCFATDVMHDHDCYRVTFDTGDSIVADAEHLWKVFSALHGKSIIVTTLELIDCLMAPHQFFIESLGFPAAPVYRRHFVAVIEKVPSVPVRCIQVEHESHMFLCGRAMIPTHNTVSQAAAMMLNAWFRKHFSILYVAPQAIFCQKLHSAYHSDMIASHSLPWKIQGKHDSNNVNSKSFSSGSKFLAASMFATPNNVLGTQADWVLMDECITKFTQIATPVGQKFISSLSPGDPILGFTADGFIHPDRVKAVVNKGVRKTWRLSLEDGSFLECTNNEKIWTNRGWAYLQEIIDDPSFLVYVRPKAEGDCCLVPLRVSSIVYLGEQEVWDVETEKHHTILANGIAVHNCQSLDYDLIPYALETLGTSDFRWETYMGTARGIEGTLQTVYEKSSMGTWHVRCNHCSHVNHFGDYEECLRIIQRAGIGCSKCSTEARPRLLTVEDGWWIPQWPDREDSFMGYHIPQIIVRDRIEPFERYTETIYDRVYGSTTVYSPAQVKEEILGISSDQGGRPLTPGQIQDASCLDISMESPPSLSPYTHVSGGADWGGSEIVSFTVGCVVARHVNGEFHVLAAARPVGLRTEEQPLPIAAMMKRAGREKLSCIAADGAFVGPLQNRTLANAAGVPCGSILYGTQKRFFTAAGGSFNVFTVDRSTLLFCTYTLISSGRLKFPKGSWFESFSKDLMAMTVEEVDTPSGIIRRYVRLPAKADDFVHALGYAVFILCAMSGLDLPSMVGLAGNASVNANSADAIGNH